MRGLFRSFRLRLAVFAVGAIAPFLLAMHWYADVHIERPGLAEGARQLDRAAEAAARQTAEWLSQSGRSFDLLSAALRPAGEAAAVASWQAEIERMHRAAPQFDWIGVADPQGRVLAATDTRRVGEDIGRFRWVGAGLDGPYADEDLAGGQGGSAAHRVVQYAAPLTNAAGAVLGVVFARLDVAWAEELRDRLAGAGRLPFDVLLLDRRGRVFDASGAAPTGEAPTATTLSSRGGGQAVPYGTGQAAVPEAGEPAGLGWRVVVRQPLEAMLGDVARQRRELFFHALGGSVAALVVLGWAGWRWGRPVERLAGQAERVEDLAELVTAVPASAPAEVRRLSVLVDRLVRSVRAGRRAVAEARHALDAQVTERTRELETLNRALSHQRDKAEAALRAKRDFLANVSHEIRTPINAIAGSLHLLRRGELGTRQAIQVDRLELASRHLLDLVDGILDLAKMEAGKFALHEEELDPREVLAEVAGMVRGSAEEKGLVVSVRADDRLPRLHGDVTRLRQALLNYAGNAVKFTDRGSVTLGVDLLEDAGEFARLRFEVRDTGIGVDPVEAPRLFAPFRQAGGTGARRRGGTGLGLAITRKLAEQMGGEAGLTSAPGEGSTFWFTVRLPRASDWAAAPPVADGDVEAVLRSRFVARRVLVVDDEPLNLEVLQAMLAEAGQSVETARSGALAVEMAKAESFDIVLMDLRMPGVDGLETARAIRSSPRHGSTPIIAVTGEASAQEKARCLEAGMNDFLAKPFRPDVLYELLFKWLSIGRTQGDGAETPDPARIAWDESFSVGHPAIDRQHRQLFALCDRLGECVAKAGPQCDEVFHEILGELADYADTHFATEEQVLARCGYPLLDAHCREHTRYREKLADFTLAATLGERDKVLLQRYLVEWMTSHVLHADMAFRDFVRTGSTGHEANAENG